MGPTGPPVSVIVPLFNGERYVAQAIESVLTQDSVSVELIVVDDASTDGSAGIVQGFGKRVRYLRVPKQPTMLATTNIGLRAATGRYLCVVHQDDYLLPGKLARQVDVMEHNPDVGFSYSAQWFVGPEGQPLGRLRSPVRRHDYVVDGRVELAHLAVQNYLNFCNVLMRRSCVDGVGAFEEPNWVIADWQMWVRLALRHQVAYVDEPLVCYRIHPEAQTLARTQRTAEWESQVRAAHADFFADPLVPAEVARLRPLADASLELNLGIFRLYRGDLAGAARSLLAVGRTAGSGLPRLLRSAAVGPRMLPRARMVLQRSGLRTPFRPGLVPSPTPAQLTCPRCSAIAGYAARAPRAASGGGRPMRCIVCGARWTSPDRKNPPPPHVIPGSTGHLGG